MKVIIAGGRDFDDFRLLYDSCIKFLSNQSKVEIVSGGAKGADALGEKYAAMAQYPVKIFEANWGEFGKSAGYRRNEEMAQYADALIAFWDGKSRGTSHMIDLAEKYGLKVRVVRY